MDESFSVRLNYCFFLKQSAIYNLARLPQPRVGGCNPRKRVSAVPHFLCPTPRLVTGKVSICARIAQGSQESERVCVCVCVSCPPSAHTHTHTHMPRSQHSSTHWKVTHLTVLPEEFTPSALRWSSSRVVAKITSHRERLHYPPLCKTAAFYSE